MDGKVPVVLGHGRGVAAGWNAANRVVLTKNAQPGQKIQIAVLGINGPISAHPDTYIWVRSATLDFYRPGKLSKARAVKLEVDKKDAALDAILPGGAKLEELAEGFAFTEGPVWIDGGNPTIAPASDDSFLLFSDPNNNTIYRMTPDGDVSVYFRLRANTLAHCVARSTRTTWPMAIPTGRRFISPRRPAFIVFA